MIGTDIFMLGVMIISTLTGLVTEGLKKILTERNTKYHANTLAAIVSLVLSACVGTGYAVVTNTAFSARVIVCIIALMFISWLCAMLGYDKVIGQLKTTKKD